MESDIQDMAMKVLAFSSMLDATPDLIFYTGTNGAYIGCNKQFEEFTGVKKKDIIGKTHKDIFFNSYKNMAESFIEADRRILTSGKTEITEESGVSENNDVKLFEIIRAPIIANDMIVGVMAIGRDITALKAAEKAVTEAAKAKGEFLAKMSHEIRMPLNAIIGMSNMAKKSIDDKEKAVASINESLKASNHLLRLLSNILDMSKIEAGAFEIISSPFNIASSYAEISDTVTQECEEKKIAFITNADSFSRANVIGDKLSLNQVIINLLGNAVKFTDSGGEISYTISASEETEKTVKLKFTVKDSGIGMNYKQVEKLFETFEQTDVAATMRYGGTGLGLAISQHIVQLMGGRIEVESVPGKGSQFSFAVDFKKDENAAHNENAQRQDASENVNLSEKRILIVEDIMINRVVLKEVLASTKVKTEEADDGTTALKKFENSPQFYYDLIFMDVQMPTMDGYETTKKIRALNRDDAKTTPIVAMTANAYKEDIDKAIESGMNAHLSKPIDVKSVIKAVNYYLNRQK